MAKFNVTDVRRIIRAHARNVAETGTEIDLEELAELRREIEDAVAVAVVGLYGRGLSWSNIGDALGVSKSAAYQRYGKFVEAEK
jgi:peptide subunit release factor RF-3